MDRRPGAERRCEVGGKERVSRVRKPAITFGAAESSAVTPGVGFGRPYVCNLDVSRPGVRGRRKPDWSGLRREQQEGKRRALTTLSKKFLLKSGQRTDVQSMLGCRWGQPSNRGIGDTG